MTQHARDRTSITVAVMDVHALGMLGVLRSLGRAGHHTVGCSSVRTAVGLASRCNREPTVCPGYDSPDFLPWLRALARERALQAIIPTEGFLIAIRPVFDEFAHLLPLIPDEHVVYPCFSKCDVVQSFALSDDPALATHLPRSVVLGQGDDARQCLARASLGAPVWLKGDAVHATGQPKSTVRRAASLEDAVTMASELLAEYRVVLAQSDAREPVQVGANFLLHGGEVLAESMMLSLHDSPHTGGTSGLRSSWWHAGIRDDALRRLRALGWSGVAMVEYKWDPTTDAFSFIEVNTRFWAGLHLDLLSGVDYPRLLVDCHLGLPVPRAVRGRQGVVSRWTLPTDWGHLLSRLRDPAVRPRDRLRSLLEFFWLFAAPGVRDDYRFPGDSALYWRQWRSFLSSKPR
jgi:hypothetical protein